MKEVSISHIIRQLRVLMGAVMKTKDPMEWEQLRRKYEIGTYEDFEFNKDYNMGKEKMSPIKIKDNISMLGSMKNMVKIKTKKPRVKKAVLQQQISPHDIRTSNINSTPRKITFRDEEKRTKRICSDMDIHSSRVEHETRISHARFVPPPLTAKNETSGCSSAKLLTEKRINRHQPDDIVLPVSEISYFS